MIIKNQQNAYADICEVVARIPYARVTTYGQVAKLAGHKNGARMVSAALKHANAELPWHRVINAQGKLSFPQNSRLYKEQKQRLLKEDIEFNKNRIDLTVYGWSSFLDEYLWKPE